MDIREAAQILYGWTPEHVDEVLAEPETLRISGEPVLIDGQPATPELWSAWERWIGADKESHRRTMEAYKSIAELAEQLKRQEDDRG